MRWWPLNRSEPDRPRQSGGWRSVPSRAVVTKAPPLVAAPRFSLPPVTGATSLLPASAPHRPNPVPKRPVTPRTSRALQAPSAPEAGPAAVPEPPPETWSSVLGDADAVGPQDWRAFEDVAAPFAEEVSYVGSDDEALPPSGEAGQMALQAPLEEPPDSAPDDDMAGIIAMLDAEVTRSRILRDPEAALREEAENRPKMYRPTLSQSRRRGLGVGIPSADRPADESAPPEGDESGASLDASPDVPADVSPVDPSEDPGVLPDAAHELVGIDDAAVEVSATGGSVVAQGADGTAEVTPSPDEVDDPVDEEALDAEPGPVPGNDGIADEPTYMTAAFEPSTRPATREPNLDRTGEKRRVPGPEAPTTSTEDEPAEQATPSFEMPQVEPARPATPLAAPSHAGSGADTDPSPDPAPGVSSAPSAAGPSASSIPPAPPQPPGGSSPSPAETPGANPGPGVLPIDPDEGESPGSFEPFEPFESVESVESAQSAGPLGTDERFEDQLSPPGLPPFEPSTTQTIPEDGAPSTSAIAPTRTIPAPDHAPNAGAARPATAAAADAPDQAPTAPLHRIPARRPPAAQENQLAAPAAAVAGPGSDFARPAPVERRPAPLEPVPPATVARFENLTGIDLGFVPINRTPEVRRTAAEIGARAYTHGGTVHLPHDLGEPDRFDNEGLVGHELAHVAQERYADGPVSADEWERQAAMVERAFRGEPVPDDWNAQFAPFAGVPQRSWSPASGFVQDLPSMPGEQLQRAPLSEASTGPEPPDHAAPSIGAELSDPGQGLDLVYGEVPEELFHAEQPPTRDVDELAAPSHWPDDDVLDAVADRLRRTLVIPDFDVDDPLMLERLADNLYGRFRGHLRQELLVDRERSGVLTEFQEE